MNILTRLALQLSANARRKRAELFRRIFDISPDTTILDIGSEDGSNIHAVLHGTAYDPRNVFVADLDEGAVKLGCSLYGFNGIVIRESGALPFADASIDIVYCSSVIEHVTVNRRDIWNLKNGEQFRSEACEHQMRFSDEIRRVGKQYFVQTPARGFPIESHTWLPLAGYLPREFFIRIMRVSNRVWLKESVPDFNLLSDGEIRVLFPDAIIEKERVFGITKSLMAIKSKRLAAGDKV